MSYTFQGGGADVYLAYNKVLGRDVIGVETDTGRYKVGDGETRWKELPYSGGDVYPQFRIDSFQWEVKTSSSAAWDYADYILGRPGTRGSYQPGSGEGRFFYDLLEGEDIGGVETPTVPPVTGETRLDTIPIAPGSGNADVTIGTTVVGVEVVNEDDAAVMVVVVEGRAFTGIRPGRSITIMNYSGFDTFEIDTTGDWSAVGFEVAE